ncbi:hypothetical protein DFP73DRAFT_562972, partial [Morchella snyderi]
MSTSTTTTNTTSTLPSPPASPSTTTSTPPSPPPARKQRPKLTLNPTTRASITDYYDSPHSCFSPDSSDDEAESDDELEKPAPLGGSYSKRFLAYNGPPSTPPSGPLPATPMRPPPPMRRPSCLSSVADFVFSPGPNTPASAPAPRGMPSAPTAPTTPHSPWSRASTQPSVDTALLGLESRLKTILGRKAPEKLDAARKERDVLLVMLQKAYYKRQEVGSLHWEWTSAEMRVKALEEKWLMEVLSGVEAMAWNIREEMTSYVQQEQSEEDECAVESEEEDEDILEVLEHTVVEPEVESPQVPSHEEQRYIWLSKPVADSEDGSSGSEAGTHTYSSKAESDNHDSKALCCSFGSSIKYYNYPKAICYDNNNSNNNNNNNSGAKDCDYNDSKAKYDNYDSRPKYHNNSNNNDSDHLSVPTLFHNDSASSSEASSSPIIPGGHDVWAPFSASDGSKPAGVVVLRIADVEMEM